MLQIEILLHGICLQDTLLRLYPLEDLLTLVHLTLPTGIKLMLLPPQRRYLQLSSLCQLGWVKLLALIPLAYNRIQLVALWLQAAVLNVVVYRG